MAFARKAEHVHDLTMRRGCRHYPAGWTGLRPYTLSNISKMPRIPSLTYSYLQPPDAQRTACLGVSENLPAQSIPGVSFVVDPPTWGECDLRSRLVRSQAIRRFTSSAHYSMFRFTKSPMSSTKFGSTHRDEFSPKIVIFTNLCVDAKIGMQRRIDDQTQ